MGLEAGANDYVVKPFKFAVLLARIRAQLRQYEASEDAVFQIGPYTFRPGSKLLTNDKGSKLKLTEKETAILRYLYRAGQKVVGRETLLAEVWGYNSERDDAHARNAHLPPAPEDRDRPLQGEHSRDGARRLQADSLRWPLTTISRSSPARRFSTCSTGMPCGSSPSRPRTGSCAPATCCSARATRSDGGYVVTRGAIALDAQDDGSPAAFIAGPGAVIGRAGPVHPDRAARDRDGARAVRR